ncbi:MAG: hypothetical protein MHMPM18_004878 [Marteilia pararefringens]
MTTGATVAISLILIAIFILALVGAFYFYKLRKERRIAKAMKEEVEDDDAKADNNSDYDLGRETEDPYADVANL